MQPEPPINSRSSEDFATGLFRPHGRVQIWVEGPVVHMLAQGPFNPEFLRAFALARAELFSKSPPPDPYVHLLQFGTSIMASPQMLEGYAEMVARAKEQPVATAWVVEPEVEGREFILPMFERINRRLGRVFRTFDKLDEARAWALAQLP